MKFCVLVLSLVSTASAFAQNATVTTTAAPIFLRAEVTTPLRVAATGSKFNILQNQGGWMQVEFQDPQLGLRVGWVQAHHLAITTVEMTPTDLSVAPRTAAQPLPSEVEYKSTADPSGARLPTIFITPTEDHFEVYLSAALAKKGVPVTVTTNSESATFVLKASAVDIQKQSTGSKFARCIFAYCAGIEDRGATSVQLLKGATVAWSYSANKGRGQKNRQSLAEAVAKHLKNEYFRIR